MEIDSISLASISNFQNSTGTTWINWSWTNPADADFNYTIVFLNGTRKTNTSLKYYNATNLAPDTSYTIGTHTVDKLGNVNLTWVNQTTKTLATPNSPPTMPTNPAPSNHAPNQSINTDLSWSCGDPDAGDTLTYDVYFGTSTTLH